MSDDKLFEFRRRDAQAGKTVKPPMQKIVIPGIPGQLPMDGNVPPLPHPFASFFTCQVPGAAVSIEHIRIKDRYDIFYNVVAADGKIVSLENRNASLSAVNEVKNAFQQAQRAYVGHRITETMKVAFGL
jgi:hypothetical protein